jgi:PAS domain S-box-containing protein
MKPIGGLFPTSDDGERSAVERELQEMRDALERATADLHHLTDATGTAALFLDCNLRLLRFTSGLDAFSDVRASDRGRPVAELAQRIGYDDVADDARRVLDTHDPVERTVTVPDGRRFRARLAPYRTADGQIDGVVATFLDINERVVAESAARRREDGFRRAIADAPIPVLLHAEDGQILALSRALTEITGYEPDELPTLDAWIEAAYGAGDYAEQTAADIDRLYELDARVDEGEYHIHTKGGEERNWQFSSSPVGTDGQGRRLIVSMAADVTNRRRAEEALRARETHLRLAVDALRLGTWDLDVRSGEAVRSARHDAIFGYDELLPEWTYEQFLSHVHPDDRASIEQSFEQAIASGTEWTFEGRIYRADGALRWIWARGVPHYDGRGELARFVGAVLDVTERKVAEAEREAQAQQQAALAAFGFYALTETDLNVLFDRAVAVVRDALRTDFSKILELQHDGESLLLRTGLGWSEGLVGTATVPTDTGSQAGYTLTVSDPVIVDDLATETRFRGPDLLTDHGVVSGMSVVIGGLDRPFGVFGTHTQTHRAFSDADARFFQSVANIVAAAIERIEAFGRLEERVAERTVHLRESESRLRLLYDIISHPAESFNEQVDRALRMTTDLLGLDAGILSHIEGDTYTVTQCYAPGTPLRAGQTFSTADTPCAITLRSEKPLLIEQLSTSEYSGHPCRDAFDIESYAAAPVRVGESIYGTLNFSGGRPKSPPFTDGDRELIALLAQWLGSALEWELTRGEVARSEQILAGVLLGSLDGIAALEAVRDDEGQIVDFVFQTVNPAAAAIYGHRAEDLIGRRYLPAFPSTVETGVFDIFVRVVETGEPQREEIYYDADGITGWFDFTVIKLGDGVAQTFRDVTEQKEVERVLRESEERFRELFESSPDAIFVETLDGVVLDVNPAACRLHNATRDWLVGRDLSELVPPEYREQARADFEHLAHGELRLLESRSFTADGLVVPVEVRTDRITYAGQEAVLLHVRDVTEREEAERALRESEERFAKAFRSAPVAMTISTFSENRFLDVNVSYCTLTGYTRDELLGRTSTELDIMLDAAPHIPGFDQLGSTGRVRNIEFPIRTKAGDIRDVLFSAELIEIGGLTCVLGIGFDVTDRKRLEREVIEAAEQERRRIGQDLHDELGQQLTGAAFISEVLSRSLAGAERAEAEDARQLTELINSVLADARDLSRLLSPVDIFADGLADALQDLADQTERIYDVPCVLDTEGDVRVADNAAATHLYRIAQEALNNAVKHAAPSSLRISLHQRPEGLRLRIEDDGTGIESIAIEQPSGIGLRTMRYRAALISGVIQIGRTATGSEVSVLIPNLDA